MEQTVNIKIPMPIIKLGFATEEIQRRVNEWLTISLFSEGYISSGKAAGLLNISRNDFLSLLRSKGVAYINYTESELEEEFEAVKKLEVTEK